MAGGSTDTFPVEGVGGVPTSGVSNVYAVFNVINPSANGCLDDFSPDVSDPNICTITADAGNNVTDSDIVQVSESGDVSVSWNSAGTAEVVVTIMGYYTDNTSDVAGDTYVGLPVVPLVDTRNGTGAPKARIPAKGSLTVQIAGQGGVPSGAVGAAVYIGAANSTTTGDVSAYPTGGTASTLSLLSYVPGQVVRDLYFGALSPSGQLTVVNQGSGPVDLIVDVQGYLAGPDAATSGSTYQGVQEEHIADTQNGLGGVGSTPIPPNGSITFQTTGGTDQIPASGVSAVAESVRGTDATATGFLSVYATGSPDPDQPGVNFYAGANQGNGLTASLVSANVSTAGEQTITNHSSGTVDVIVTIRGYYIAPAAPAPPESVTAIVSGQTATVSWAAPAGDGGSPITGYTITASPDASTTTVDGNTYQATLSGLANAAADTFSVTAANAVGSSDASTYSPPNVISGTVLAPSGQPVAGATVNILPSDAPASDPDSWSPNLIGTATTDANGIWTFTVPPYSSLPADSQAAADNDGGYLNMDASVVAFATTASGATYNVAADAVRSAFVGTSSQPSGPVTVADPAGGTPEMVVTPDQTDLGANDTVANEDATVGYQNSATLTDSNDNIIGDPDDAYASGPTDAYGYQSIDGSNNDGYDPYLAADGTDLSAATVTATVPSSAPQGSKYCAPVSDGGGIPPGYEFKWFTDKVWKKYAYTVIGEYHIWWDGTASFSWDQNATASVGVDISANDQDFTFDSWVTYDQTSGGSAGPSGVAAESAHQVSISLNYVKSHRLMDVVPTDDPVQSMSIATCFNRWFIKEEGLYNPGGGWQYIKTNSKSLLSHDGVSGWLADFPKSYDNMNSYGANYQLCVSHGKGLDYGAAAGFGNVTIKEETDHSSDTEQCDNWGDATRSDYMSGKKDGLHYAWGSNKKPSKNPQVFYNY
jgi:hypothetical protein